MSPTSIILLRVLHIVTAVFWVGAVLFITMFLTPAIRGVGPAGGAVMSQLVQVRRLPMYMMGASVITLISGFLLYWADARLGGNEWLGSGAGRVFGLGGVLALVGGIAGTAVNAPTGKQLGALGAAMAVAGRPPTPEELATMERLQRRMATASVFVAILLVVSTVCMAVAPYVT